MQKIFTSDDLLRFVCDEMQPDEAAEFRSELMGSPDYREGLPQKGITQSILAYSASLRIGKVPSSGVPYEVVLN